MVGYKKKIGPNKFASIYNSDNLFCNKVSIKSLSQIDSPNLDEALISWIDIKTESGFTRVYNKINIFMTKIIIL